MMAPKAATSLTDYLNMFKFALAGYPASIADGI
jgi:hypothetical protein